MNKLKGNIYDVVLRLARFGFRKQPVKKKLLIVRVDEIGDYMLWHSFLKEITQAERFNGYEIHFCGNQSWKTLFNTFDAKWVHQACWMDKIRFKKDMGYRYRFLKQIFHEHYEVVINPTYSRDKRYDDSIVRAAKSPLTFGMVANQESVHSYEIGYDRSLYAHLYYHPEKPLFEFYRNKLFTEFITQDHSTVSNTVIDGGLLPVLSFTLPEKYFVVFPGSRSAKRIWPAEHFVLVANYIYENFGWTAVLAGTKNDERYTSAFAALYKNPITDLTGKTSLTEMMSVLQNAQCLLSVDTGSVHLAAAVGCTVFGVFNGSQYKRFAPYPAEISPNFYAVYPDDVAAELQNEELVLSKYEFVVDIPYASVKAEKVILAIHNHYTQK